MHQFRQSVTVEPNVNSTTGHSNDPSSLMERSEEQSLVEQQIQKLPSREQELLALRLSHGMSYKQIAEITGLTTSNVGFLLHQALVRLKTALVNDT